MVNKPLRKNSLSQNEGQNACQIVNVPIYGGTRSFVGKPPPQVCYPARGVRRRTIKNRSESGEGRRQPAKLPKFSKLRKPY